MACVEPCDWAPAISIAACPLPMHQANGRLLSLQSLGRTLSLRSAPSSGASTKQNTRAETFAALSFWNIQMFRFQPTKQRYSLCQYPITLEIVGSDGPWRDGTGYLRCKSTATRLICEDGAMQNGTHNSYNLFMTNFSMPSIALSNSASEEFLQTSHSRIRTEMNC